MLKATGIHQRTAWLVPIGVVLLAFLTVTLWKLYREIRQSQLNDALWKAVERGDPFAVTSLLDQGADPNTNEYQVLDGRHRLGLGAIVTRLQGHEPRYNQDPMTNKWTANPRVAGNWTARQKWNTVLWLATELDRPDVVRALLARGAKDKATGYLSTALMWAVEGGHADIVRSLLANGSDVNATDDFGGTALDEAAVRGDVEIARLLLQNGADIGQSGALAAAKARGHTAIVDLIEQFDGPKAKGNASSNTDP